MTTTTKNTNELKVGDIVLCHGMRCLITEPMRLSTSHRVDPFYGACYWTVATVLNRNEVPADLVPMGFTRNHDGTHTWTIQGAEALTWTIA